MAFTQVGLDNDLNVLASVRQSLGADISGSLFSSTKNALVEGFTDKLYLNTFSNYSADRPQTRRSTTRPA